MTTQATAAPPAEPRRPPVQVRCASGSMWQINPNHVSIYGYKTAHTWLEILADGYFLPIAHWFLDREVAGKRQWKPDRIMVYREITVGGPGGEVRYYEQMDVVVCYADGQTVRVMPLAAPLVIGADVPPSWPPADVLAEAAASDPQKERPARRAN